MVNESDYNKLLDKVEKVTKQRELDLSSDEDLSIGIMNLIAIEEHLFFTANKVNKDAYYEILYEVREMRKELLKKIIKEYEGEVWCISKHLLSSSMRLMEVGTKQLTKGDKKEAKAMFEKAYQLYSLFWALNLKVVSSKMIQEEGIVTKKEIEEAEKDPEHKHSIHDTADKAHSGVHNADDPKKKRFLTKAADAFKNLIDCCKE